MTDRELPEMRAVILGQGDAVTQLGFEMIGAEQIADGVAVVPWAMDEDSWVELVRICHRAGCVPMPALNREQALRIAEAHRAPLATEIGDW